MVSQEEEEEYLLRKVRARSIIMLAIHLNRFHYRSSTRIQITESPLPKWKNLANRRSVSHSYSGQ